MKGDKIKTGQLLKQERSVTANYAPADLPFIGSDNVLTIIL